MKAVLQTYWGYWFYNEFLESSAFSIEKKILILKKWKIVNRIEFTDGIILYFFYMFDCRKTSAILSVKKKLFSFRCRGNFVFYQETVLNSEPVTFVRVK